MQQQNEQCWGVRHSPEMNFHPTSTTRRFLEQKLGRHASPLHTWLWSRWRCATLRADSDRRRGTLGVRTQRYSLPVKISSRPRPDFNLRCFDFRFASFKLSRGAPLKQISNHIYKWIKLAQARITAAQQATRAQRSCLKFSLGPPQ
jgi:hypothetical protein